MRNVYKLRERIPEFEVSNKETKTDVDEESLGANF